MVEVRIRQGESLQSQVPLLWDSNWIQSFGADGYADWTVSPVGTPGNSGGLTADANLATAIILCLFTWRIADPGDGLPDDMSTDRKGWWGDAVDLEDDETVLGSKLWQLMRSTLTAATPGKAVQICQVALQPLITQGAVARFVVTSGALLSQSLLWISIDAYSQAGTLVYSQKFENVWAQLVP